MPAPLRALWVGRTETECGQSLQTATRLPRGPLCPPSTKGRPPEGPWAPRRIWETCA